MDTQIEDKKIVKYQPKKIVELDCLISNLDTQRRKLIAEKKEVNRYRIDEIGTEIDKFRKEKILLL